MSGYTDIPSNIESSRKSRRIIHEDQEFSNQSILNVIEKFVKTVNAMEETILVPSRLMDRQVGDSTDSIIPPAAKTTHHKRKSTIRDHLVSTDLFNLYNTLNSVKVGLLWGRNRQEEPAELSDDELKEQNYDTPLATEVTKVAVDADSSVTVVAVQSPVTESNTTIANNSQQQTKGHIRRPSTVSVSSSNSASTISDSESEVSSNENDSGIESEGQQEVDKSLELSRQFQSHLYGLYKSLEQMTEAANYLTARYQCDIGGA